MTEKAHGGAADEARFREYFEQIPCYLTVQDRALRVLHANRLFREDFGEPAGRTCFQLYKHRSEPCEACPVERTFRDGQRHTSEQQLRARDGREISVIVYTTPIRDPSGDIVAVLETSTDITEVKYLQEQLRESQRRYRQLFEEVPCLLSIQDRDLRIVETNRRFRDHFGDHHLGTRCFEAYKHRDHECVPCPVQETFSDGKVHHSEEIVASRDGEPMNTLVYATPIRDAAGAIVGVMEMSTDITPIRQLQSQLESIGMLVSSVSHGLKGLLTGLEGGRYLVNTGLKKSQQDRVRQGWEMVERNVDRIRNMVLNILYYAKEREPCRASVQADAVLAEIHEIIAPRALEHQIELLVRVDPSAGVIEADPAQLRAMLVNLAENSVDACRVDKQKASHQVTLAARGNGESVCFEVSDNGIGMDRETRERVFTLFFSSKGSEGTGLGLFVANSIARAHGGTIRVDSALERGTRFIVELPRVLPGSPAPTAGSVVE